MRKYFAIYPRNFGNEYTLVYTESAEDEQEIEDMKDDIYANGGSVDRVTLEKIRCLNRDECYAREFDPNFSGYCNLVPISMGEYKRQY
jgi:hypothetical protein